MDDQRLASVKSTTALIVPTRSLANSLGERVARYQINLGKSVWATPTIVVWADYLRLLWQLNRDAIARQCGAVNLISASQASLLWAQVIENSRRGESDLTLLNVQQTTKAAQRSWKVMHDWQIQTTALEQDHVADTDQFVAWAEAYQVLLDKRGLIDESGFMTALLSPDFVIKHPYAELVWVSYDLLTGAQRKYLNKAQDRGVVVAFEHPSVEHQSETYIRYDDSTSEIKAALEHARFCVESDANHTVNLTVPDLQLRLNQVTELARDVFYASATPYEVEQGDTVYSINLGQKMSDIAAIEAALSLINVLKNKSNIVDLGFLLRNRFVGLSDHHKHAIRLFEQWLKRQRIHSVLFDQLPSLYEQCLEYFTERDVDIESLGGEEFLPALQRLVAQRQSIQSKLSAAKKNSGFSALGFNEWVKIFNDWLMAWQWRTNTSELHMSSTQYQLRNRWHKLLEEFANLTAVQRRAGLARSIELITLMARNIVFTPKCAASPIMITGVLEAIGNVADTCIVTGMNQDYPSPPAVDAFISNRFLMDAGHPQATAESGFLHSQSVMNHLLSCAKNIRVSYAVNSDTNREVAMQASPLFRNQAFTSAVVCAEDVSSHTTVTLQRYQDTQGPAWSEPGRAKGGSRIFENQSNCAFKAFVTHQLGFLDERDAEFGLDGLDRGNIVHHLLDLLWQKLQSQEALLALSIEERLTLIEQLIERVLSDGSLKLSHEKLTLLQHERGRLQKLLMAWLDEESKRPAPFSVVEREEERLGELGGIQYKFIIDRLDLTHDGRSVIIDYKTGNVNRNDWTGERIKSPQMPLYALAIDKVKHQPVSGIAFAQVKQGDLKYSELSEADIFRKETKATLNNADQWHVLRASWPSIFEQLAHDFLAGDATVNPVDKATCQYCELHSMCRVSQLRQLSSVLNETEAQL